MGVLDGKVALITGAASGLGRATAQMFAHEGASVVVADINQVGGDETVGLIEGAGGRAVFVEADVSRSADAQAMVRAAVETYGGLDCAVNNAAGGDASRVAIADLPDEEWERAIAVNLTGVFLGMKYQIRAMLERGGGAIVNIGSVASVVGRPNIPWYVAAKHGLVGLTKSAAIDYGAKGIRVNAVLPGSMWTPALRHHNELEPQHIQSLVAEQPIGRVGEPEEVAAAVLWLCSDASSYVLGHALSADGGYVIQ